MDSEDLIIGIVVGLILSLTGAGGSVVASPMLVFFSAVSINDATGLVLAAVCISSACASLYGFWRGRFSFRPVAILAFSGIITSSLARSVVPSIDAKLMGILFSLMAFSFASYYLLGGVIYRWFQTRYGYTFQPSGNISLGQLSLWGGFAGALSGFFGIGGGIVIMPVIMQVMRVPAQQAIYYCLPVIFLFTLSGSLTFVSYAESDILLHLLALALGALVGSAAGLALLPFFNIKYNLKLLGILVLFTAFSTMYNSLIS